MNKDSPPFSQNIKRFLMFKTLKDIHSLIDKENIQKTKDKKVVATVLIISIVLLSLFLYLFVSAVNKSKDIKSGFSLSIGAPSIYSKGSASIDTINRSKIIVTKQMAC